MRLDRHLVESMDVASRTLAAKLIAAGRVSVDGVVVGKASREVPDGARVEIRPASGREYVSRAGHKLAGALEAFPGVTVRGVRCLDAGASTGGFTQVLLEAGAAHVAAVDVGHGQLDPRIRADPRVTAYEGLNVRDLTPEAVGGRVGLVVGDLSFISLRLVVAPLAGVLVPGGELILMVKPQFEVGRAGLGKGGVVRDEGARLRAVEGVRKAALDAGLEVLGDRESPLAGQDGNREHFLHLRRA